MLFLQTLVVAAPAFTIDQAVDVAMQRNRSLVAARLAICEADIERFSAGLLANPELEYSIANVVVGEANPQEQDLHPAPFEQSIQSIGVSQVLDVWLKRRLRVDAASHGVREAHLNVQDAVREVQFAVRVAFADTVREQSESALARETRLRYDQTVDLSRRRREAGDIAEAELQKIQLEGLKYVNAEFDADLQLQLSRHKLAELLALDDIADLPEELATPTFSPRPGDLTTWTAKALVERPDLQASRVAEQRAAADFRAEEREALPDLSVGLAYTRSKFQISGDNPYTLGAQVALPIPLFDRNQAGVRRAVVNQRLAENQRIALEMQIRREVRDAVGKLRSASSMLQTFEQGAMLQRAERALSVAEKSYGAGAVSFLEILEAQRAYLETRAHYLTVRDTYQQAAIEMAYVTGVDVP